MSSSTIDYTYRYPFESAVSVSGRAETKFALATSDRDGSQPDFFSGKILQPKLFADMLLVLSDVVRSHFFLQRPSMMDPVITTSSSMLRFEGFSGCCGAYVRVDLDESFFDGQFINPGTTNVDFNDPMCGALSRIQDSNDVQFRVGRESVELTPDDQSYIEKKVKLPIRWIKGFGEVQTYLPSLEPRMEIPSSEALRFVRSLPRSNSPKQKVWAKAMGRSLRLTQRRQSGAVPFMGTHRVRILEPLLWNQGSLRIYDARESGVSGWEFRSDFGRLLLVLSPEVYRGFSGEGQILQSISSNEWKAILDPVKTRLQSQEMIDAQKVSDELNCASDAVEAALAVLGSRGLAGYDVNNEAYYYRELPFDLEQVEQLQPRLKAARKLIDNGGIVIRKQSNAGQYEIKVPGTGVDHLVRLSSEQDRCSCPWFSRYQGERGPCKHILAARMTVDQEQLG